MSTPDQNPRITTLIDPYPLPIKNLVLLGCKIAEGVRLGVAVDEEDGSFLAGITCHMSDDAEDFLLDEGLNPTELPSADIASPVIAQAVTDAGGFDTEDLATEIFAAIIAGYGTVTIEHDGGGSEAEGYEDSNFTVTIEAGEFTASHTFAFAELSAYLVPTEDDMDEEGGQDEATEA